jgi:hypothetical protein
MTAKDELGNLIKKEYEKQGKPISDSEASEAANNLVGYFDILYKISIRIAKLDRRLKSEPAGFPIDGPHSCILCGRSIDQTTGWYHRGGQRCLTCHKAIIGGIVPPFVLWAHDSYFKMWKLKEFGVHSTTARKYVKDGRLKARIIMGENSRPYEYIFLKKENPELVACEKWNPIYKSQKRHRDKVYSAYSRKEKEELRQKMAQ